MTRGRLGLAAAACAGALAANAPAEAHHAIGAVVDLNTEIVHTMTLIRIDWINPHSWFHFSMSGPGGKVVPDVMIEWASLAGLRQYGYTSEAVFPVGDTFTVTYNPNRDGSVGGHMVKMVDNTSGKVFDY